MQKSKMKLVFVLGLFIIFFSLLGLSVYAANENVQIIKKSDTDYLIYVKNNLNRTFEFAFSNDNTADKDSLTYLTAATDATDGGNYIAYINAYTVEHKHMWVRDSEGNYLLEAVELNLDVAIDEDELQQIQDVTKIIEADTTQTKVEEKTIEGNKVTVTTGKVVLKNEGDYDYKIVKLPNTTEYNDFMDLAERISKINSETDMYTKLDLYTRFNDLYDDLSTELSEENWIEVQNQEILQPEDTKNGDKYVLWIKQTTENGEILDVQFLTSKYEEEKVVEKITTKLPVTYDNNTLLIVLAILVVAIVVVSLRIKSLKKEDK